MLLLTVLVVAALEAAEAAELNDGTTITVSLEPGLDEIFDEGTRRLHEKSTWKLWQWPPDEREFFDADSFRYLVSIAVSLPHCMRPRTSDTILRLKVPLFLENCLVFCSSFF